MWPMWLRILAVPFRFLAIILYALPFFLIGLVDSDLANYTIMWVIEVGNKEWDKIGK